MIDGTQKPILYTRAISPFGVELTVEGGTLFDWAQACRTLMLEHRLVLARTGATLTDSQFLNFGQILGNGSDPFLHWDFGPFMELKVDPKAVNYLFSREPVPLHWDGAFHQVPSYLVFHCVESTPITQGGETIFADTESIYAQASETDQKSWQQLTLTYKTEKKAHYGGAFSTPLVSTHPKYGTKTLRFAEPVATYLNPVSLSIEGCDPIRQDALVRDLSKRCYQPDFCYAHQWQVGDLLIADNHALVHGRHAIKQDQTRRIQRLQLL